MLNLLCHVGARLRAAALAAAAAAGCAHAPAAAERFRPAAEPLAGPPTLEVTCPSLGPGGRLAEEQVMAGMGCSGGNQSPHVAWRGAPAGTRSFAVVLHDPDAPTGVGFFHWAVADIPAGVGALAAGVAPASPAVVGLSDAGVPGYLGACPPPGPSHRYVVTVYALDVARIGAAPPFTGALLRFLVRGHVLAYGQVVGTYGRGP